MKAAIASGAKFLFNSSVLTAAFIAAMTFTNVGVWPAIALICIVALFFLFLEGKVSKALIRSKSGTVTIEGK
jgi:hypothetical protein